MPNISIIALAQFFAQSPFQTLITLFLRTAVQSRTSFNYRNRYFSIIHIFLNGKMETNSLC